MSTPNGQPENGQPGNGQPGSAGRKPVSKSRAERVAARVVRGVRRVPAAEAVAVRALDGLRSSTLARTAVSRAFDMDLGGIGGTVFLESGTLLAGIGLDNVPVVILSLVDAPEEQVPDLLEEIAVEQVLTGGFRPVLVISGDHFGAVREFGWPVELVLGRAAWDRQDPVTDERGWDAYLDRRLQEMRRNYRAAAILQFGPQHPMTLTYLRSLGPSSS